MVNNVFKDLIASTMEVYIDDMFGKNCTTHHSVSAGSNTTWVLITL